MFEQVSPTPAGSGVVPMLTPVQKNRSRSQGNGAYWQSPPLVSQNCSCLLPNKPQENHNFKTYFIWESQNYFGRSLKVGKRELIPSQLPPHDKKEKLQHKAYWSQLQKYIRRSAMLQNVHIWRSNFECK